MWSRDLQPVAARRRSRCLFYKYYYLISVFRLLQKDGSNKNPSPLHKLHSMEDFVARVSLFKKFARSLSLCTVVVGWLDGGESISPKRAAAALLKHTTRETQVYLYIFSLFGTQQLQHAVVIKISTQLLPLIKWEFTLPLKTARSPLSTHNPPSED